VLQAGLVGLPPFVGELAEQARAFGPALLVAAFPRIDLGGNLAQGVERLGLGVGGFDVLGRTKAHLFHEPVALPAERPSATPARRDDQIQVIAAGIHNAGSQCERGRRLRVDAARTNWAAQGIFHPSDKQKWIDRGVWKPPSAEGQNK
jgi:hypothetical protein